MGKYIRDKVSRDKGILNSNFLNAVILCIAVLYVVSPVMIFLLGWTKKVIAVPGCILCVYFIFRIVRVLTAETEYLDKVRAEKSTVKFWVISVMLIVLWVFFSGIGGFSCQTDDFVVRNPMFHDLLSYSWPVYYDLAQQPPFVQEIVGNTGTATYVYYFAWWLPVAALAKIFGWEQQVSDVALFLWAVLGIFLIFYCLVRYFKKHSYWILAALVLFGGMDFIMYALINAKIPITTHVEGWAGYFQYSANTTQLYWVFNQSIPTWLVVSLLLLLKDGKKAAGLCSLVFAYSPFATMGIVPIALAGCLKKQKDMLRSVAEAVSIENVLMPAMMLAVFGTFYMQNSHSLTRMGFMFGLYPGFEPVSMYISFLVLETLVYFMLMGQYAWNFPYYWVVLAELVCIPLYVMGMANDFAMRASIPALFLLMSFLVQYLLDDKVKAQYPKRRKVAVAVILVGFLTSVSELQRNVTVTIMHEKAEYIKESVGSFGRVRTELEDRTGIYFIQCRSMEEQVRINFNQYTPIDYQDSFFYKHIAKR